MGLFNKNKYINYTIEIHGMKCSMCESHINDVIRKNFDVKSVKSNHHKNVTIIKSLDELDINKLKNVILNTGYVMKGVVKEYK